MSGPQPKAAGIAVDAHGGPVFDPTANVSALVLAANQRQDDLRVLTKELQDYKIACVKEEVVMHAKHQAELRVAESARLDSIRQVDREDVAKTAASANLAIGTLAKQTTDLSITLQNQVQTAANAVETRRSADMSEVNKRVSALELASSATAGKQTVADPQMVELVSEMRAMRHTQATGAGKSAGVSWIGTLIAGGVALVAAGIGIIASVVGIGAVVYAILTK